MLRKAIRTVTQSEQRGLMQVIKELRKEKSPKSRKISPIISSPLPITILPIAFSLKTAQLPNRLV